jgi:hypothetical protein
MKNLSLILWQREIKKEEVRFFVERQRLSVVHASICSLVFPIGQLYIYPTIRDHYEFYHMPIPELLRYSPFFAWVSFFIILHIATHFLNTPPDYKRVDAIASKYKAGELIKTKDLRDNKYTWVITTIFIVLGSIMVVTTILPMQLILYSVK